MLNYWTYISLSYSKMSQRFPNLDLGAPHGLSPKPSIPPGESGSRGDADDTSWLDDYEMAELVWINGEPKLLYDREEIPRDKPRANTPPSSPAQYHGLVPTLSADGAPPLPVTDATVPCPIQVADVPFLAEDQHPKRRARRAATGSNTNPHITGSEGCQLERCSTCAAKRRRAAALHNLTAKKRRKELNQKIKELHKLLPGSRKADSNVSVLEEAIIYVKQLQAQAQMMRSMVAGMQASLATAAAAAAHMGQFRVGMGAPLSSCVHPSAVLQGFTNSRNDVQQNWGRNMMAAMYCPLPQRVDQQQVKSSEKRKKGQARAGSNCAGADK